MTNRNWGDLKVKTIDEKMLLQKKLKRLTKTPEWISDPNIRSTVNNIRAELFPETFKKKDTSNQEPP